MENKFELLKRIFLSTISIDCDYEKSITRFYYAENKKYGPGNSDKVIKYESDKDCINYNYKIYKSSDRGEENFYFVVKITKMPCYTWWKKVDKSRYLSILEVWKEVKRSYADDNNKIDTIYFDSEYDVDKVNSFKIQKDIFDLIEKLNSDKNNKSLNSKISIYIKGTDRLVDKSVLRDQKLDQILDSDIIPPSY